MASKGGPVAAGTDGNDYMYRQKVADYYFISAQNKTRLRYCIFFHYLLFFVMAAKLLADILDRLDIFILEIEELEIPKPLIWEYIWSFSVTVSFFALSSMRRNSIASMKRYIKGIIIFGIFPVLYAVVYYFPDVLTYITTKSTADIQVWRGFPYCMLWYFYLALALQIHGFSLYFALNLHAAWSERAKTKHS